MKSSRKVAVLGAGVIGCGWAVRFLAFGWDVVVFDPQPAAGDHVRQTLARAKAHVQAIHPTAGFSGRLSFTQDLSEALADAHWVQESVPEQLALKRSLLAAVDAPGAVIASSTSGFKPSELGAELSCADRLLVCHPFNPVYLLPVVEVVAHPTCDETFVSSAEATLRSLGMRPLRIRKEIPAHVADRLMEAVWREALWLIRDGVATTDEIDTAITHGFGLRWAQMGLFETYRLGGGEAGFAQFLRQFGPALQWPWSRLTDVPELDDSLVQKIVTQSEAQSGALSIRQLTEQRDRNLVALLRTLMAEGSAAGAHLAAFNAAAEKEADS